MNAESYAPAPGGLLFRWERPRRRHFAIAGFLLASAALHALCFYLFQVVYPPAISLLPPPAQVSVIAPTSDEARTFLNWLDAEDPALASQTAAAGGRARLSIAETRARSFVSCRPAAAEGVASAEDLRRYAFGDAAGAGPGPGCSELGSACAGDDGPDFFRRLASCPSRIRS